MENKRAVRICMASAFILISVLFANLENSSAFGKPVSSSASLRGRSLLNLSPRNTCRFNRAICREPSSAGPRCWNEVCVDTSNNNNNCGSCGRDCRFGRTCCDGECVDLQRDEVNCGRCGVGCPRRISNNNLRRRCENGLCDYN